MNSSETRPTPTEILGGTTPLGRLLRRVTPGSGQEAATRRGADHRGESTQGPFATVLVRTTGERPEVLRTTLESLVTQTLPDFEVFVLAHTASNDNGAGVQAVIESLSDSLTERITLMTVVGGRRGRPLNAGLERARGHYVAFLDDDDLAKPTWIEQFHQGAERAPGRIIRAIVADRPIRATSDVPGFEVLGPEVVPEDRRSFDFLTLFTRSRTPNCSIAVPLEAVRTLDLRFREDLEVLEDWDFLIRASSLLGVHDTGQVTAVYQRWQDGQSSLDAIGTDRWQQIRQSVLDDLDGEPLLLPSGSVRRLVDLYEQIAELRGEARRHAETQEELAEAQRRIAAIESSTSWRLTAPLRAVLDRARTALRS